MPQRKKAERNKATEPFESPMAMLKADHAQVKALFKKFESASDRMTKAKQQMVEEVLAALEVHAQIEEEIFYPAVKAIGEKESNKLIAESTEEHLVVKHLMQEMRGLAASDEQGRVPARCGYCFGTSPIPAISSASAGHEFSKLVFNPSLVPVSLYLSTLSLSTPRSSTALLF
jgi:hemerythrin-like domain-containing protein